MSSNQKNLAIEIDRLAVQLAKDPHSKVFLPLAEEYSKAGMWQEAAGVLEDGLKYYPGFITAMVVLGRAYDQLGQPTKAKAILEEAVKLSPENLRAHRTLIKIYVAQGMTEGALKSCDVILGMNPRDEEALSVQAKLGRPAKQEAKPVTKVVPAKGTAPVREPERADTPEEPKDTIEAISAFVESPEDSMAAASPIAMARTIMETTLQTHDLKASEQPASDEPPPERNALNVRSSPHAKTIAQLESWLRSIEQERRDRSASGEPSSSTSQ